MQGQWLDPSYRERDLGVIVSNNLKTHSQCVAVEAKNNAEKMLRIIKTNGSYKSKEVVTKLYNL